MVEYAHKSGCCDRVDTTTNASLLTPDLSDRIIKAGLNRINISIEGIDSRQYADFSQYKIDYDKLVSNIKYFYDNRKQCEMIVKTNGDILTEEQRQKFLRDFGDITDGIFIESIMECWPTFKLDKVTVNDTRGIYGQEIKEVTVCPYVFYSVAINSDGSISLCFLDWSRKLVIGDARTESLKDVWLGDKMKSWQKLFLQGERKNHPVCSNCGQLRQGQPDNIDAFSEDILKRL